MDTLDWILKRVTHLEIQYLKGIYFYTYYRRKYYKGNNTNLYSTLKEIKERIEKGE